jgi:hypothetical protein
MLEVLELLVRQEWAANDVHRFLDRLYGNSWRGARLNRALHRAEESESDEDREQAQRDLVREAEREIEQVREELAICEQEQGPLSQVGEAARLLEAMNSRRWSPIRQREMFLRRSIDRKVRVLIELRREADRAEDLPGEQTGTHPRFHPGTGSTSGQSSGGQQGGTPVTGGALSFESPAPSPEELGAGNDRSDLKIVIQGLNQGTKPLSPLISAQAPEPILAGFLGEQDVLRALAAIGRSDRSLDSVWSRSGRS